MVPPGRVRKTEQAEVFTCSSCFLVQHRHRLALQKGDQQI